MLESKIEKDIKKYLLSLGGYVIKGDTNIIGTPDIICCINGKFLAIEVKQPNKSPRINQISNLTNIRKAGGVSFYSDSLEHTKSTLKQLKLI